ncbi:MAG: Si-specific NAD(P)(+) transhydrogenase [Phycisphaeraceae bacterium]
MRHYDLAVIGTGPAGQKAAIQAAKLGKRVAILEKEGVVGGAQVNTGTLPSKAMREAALHLTGSNRRGLFGHHARVKRHVLISDLISVSSQVSQHEWDVIGDAFERNGVDLIWGTAHFEGPNLLHIARGHENELITADHFVICVGTRPARPESIPFNDNNIFCSDSLLRMEALPKSMIIVGGGVIGTEYACIMSLLGVRVTLVEGRDQVLGFLDREIAEAFQYFLRQRGITLRLGEKVDAIEVLQPVNGEGLLVQATLESGKHLKAQTLLFCVGRQGVCKQLGLENVGLEFDDRERLTVNENYQTSVPHVYAAGDVIGFPALASTAMEQGRLAVCHMFGAPTKSMPELYPLGIYSVPEISMVGKTGKQLTDEGIPYEAGIATYKEIARGQLLGDDTGMLKLLIHEQDHRILGIHAIGTQATELIHIGQAVMALGGTVEYFVNNVFNFPTLAEAYKIAALNGLNKLQHV